MGASPRGAAMPAPTGPSAPCHRDRAPREGRRAREREEEEQAVHPAVDAVEEEQPAGRDDPGRDQRDRRSGEASAEERDERQARDGEEDGRDAQASEPPARDGPQPTRRGSGTGHRPGRVSRAHDACQESRPTNSASVSSSWGGQAINWWRRKTLRREREPADPEPEPPAGSERATGRLRRRDRVASARACRSLASSGIGHPRC